MSYTAPTADNIQFDFTESGYTAPLGDNVLFEFGGAVSVSAPSAKFFISPSLKTRIEYRLSSPPAKFHYKGLSSSAFTDVVSSPSARFSLSGISELVLSAYITAPAATFYHKALVDYIDSYKPPVALSSFINMTNARRDKAVSYDKNHAFDMGPVERGNIDEGLIVRPWRARVEGNDVYLAYASLYRGIWEEEFIEFTLPHDSVFSMDLTFDQNGLPFACWERNGRVYVYGYDPSISDMNIYYVCDGRTPRARLDGKMRHQIPDSDIYLFYIDDSVNKLMYRIQRDRYDTAYSVNLLLKAEKIYEMVEDPDTGEESLQHTDTEYTYTDTQNLYLEVLAMARDYRLYIWMSEYLPENEGSHYDAYQLRWRHSAVYPYYFNEEIEVKTDIMADARHKLEYPMKDMADISLDIDDSIYSVILRDAMIHADMTDEECDVGDSITEVILREAILQGDLTDEGMDLDGDEITAVQLRLAIFSDDMSDEELELKEDQILSVTLE